MTEFEGRTRMPPRERFAGGEQVFRLDDEFARLPSESTARQGHMQKALYRHGPLTTAIFEFEQGGQIDQHALDGESILHVLEGRVTVRTAAAAYDLGPGEMLLLDPNIPHDVLAAERSKMLMTVVLMNGKRPAF